MSVSVLCIFLISQHISYGTTLVSGLVLFLFLGLLGSAVFYTSVSMLKTERYLARIVGISYMLGILLQFANNNFVNRETAEAVILSIFLLILITLLVKTGQRSEYDEQNGNETILTDSQKSKRAVAGILLILLVVLMTCIFSTLDNAVTLVHATGAVDIGQWPRILLACSGLAAVFFAVFFTTSFMELSCYMEIQELWAGMGRAVNDLKPKDKLQEVSEAFSFTPRETEVYNYLVNTENSIQVIADNLNISRRTLERHISAIYEKTGVKSRVGLIRIYNDK